MEVEWVWEHRGRPVFKFRGVDSISDAELLQGAEVRIPAEERPELPPGEFYHSDLIGCDVVERQTGQVLGTVRELQEHGGPGLLAVDRTEGELLVPFARSICTEIDVAGRRIVVDLPEGLKEL
jgi:16S rRNA processing protein RimM